MRAALMGSIALLALAAPRNAEAQEGWWDWTLSRLSLRVETGRRAVPRSVPEVVYAPGPSYAYPPAYTPESRHGSAKARKGPAFCRSGAGHPVHGRRWCLQKGFGLGGTAHGRTYRPAYRPVRWERRDWQRALPGFRPRHPSGYLGAVGLRSLLGPVVYGRLDRDRARLGGRAALSGRWIRPDGLTLVLQIRSGPVAVAELTDYRADGLFDVVLVATR